MIIKLSKPLGEWVTKSKARFRLDIFSSALLQMTVLYFVGGALIFVTVGSVVDSVVRESFFDVALEETGEPVELAFTEVRNQLWFGRAVQLLLFAIGAFFLAVWTMGPLRASSERQRRFVSTVSHQLRTPLAVMQNSLEVALRRPEGLTEEKMKNLMVSNLEETKRLSDIIKFLLAFSVFENRRRNFHLKKVDLVMPVQSVVHLLQEEASRKDVRLSSEIPDAPMTIWGDETALHEAISNLVKNAIVYTPFGRQVKVKVYKDSKRIILQVSDTGVGIDNKDLPQIFEPFFRSDRTNHNIDAKNGVGLGLSIVREIVLLHNATISVASELDKGTAFTIKFRIA